MICKGDDRISQQANANATLLMNCLVRSVLCSKQVIEQYRLSAEAFEWILGEIEARFQQAMVRTPRRAGARVCLLFFFCRPLVQYYSTLMYKTSCEYFSQVSFV